MFFQQTIRKYNKYKTFENNFKIELICLVLVYTSTELVKTYIISI